MEFWGCEVKSGETVKVDPTEFEACLHLSQAALGEAKKDKNEPVVLYLKVDGQKFVLGTLSRERIPHISFELVLEKKFELFHNSKSASVHFCGYKAYYPDEESDEDDFSESDEDVPVLNAANRQPKTKAEALTAKAKKPDAKAGTSAKQVKVVDQKKEEEESEDESDDDDESDEDVPVLNAANGKPKTKAEALKAKKRDAKAGTSAKQVKVVDPKKEEEGSEDESDDDYESDEMEDADSDDDSESDEDDEDTPAKKFLKADQGKKRPNESASKTPASNKKAKNVTPEKTDGKKGGHIATPHPNKKGGKTPNSEAKTQTPKSGGQFSCNSCSKTFNTDAGFQQHNKAKHGQ